MTGKEENLDGPTVSCSADGSKSATGPMTNALVRGTEGCTLSKSFSASKTAIAKAAYLDFDELTKASMLGRGARTGGGAFSGSNPCLEFKRAYPISLITSARTTSRSACAKLASLQKAAEDGTGLGPEFCNIVVDAASRTSFLPQLKYA